MFSFLSVFWSARWYFLLGLLLLLVFLALTLPLHFAWPYVKPELGRLPVKVEQVTGSLWNGQLIGKHPQFGRLAMEWSLSPWSLMALEPEADIEVENEQLHLEGVVSSTLDANISVRSMSGFINVALLESSLKREKISAAGELELSDFGLQWSANERQVKNIGGRLVFSGGPASFPMGRKMTTVEVPLLVGQFGMKGTEAQLVILSEDQTELGTAVVKPDGWGSVAIRRRFIDAIGQKWPQKASEDTIIFEVSRKIL
ncbi:MAG: type II secretion system protein N [Oceanobacter sp.]